MLKDLAEHYDKNYAGYTSAMSHWQGGTTHNWIAGMQPYRHHFVGPKVLVLGCSIGYEVWALVQFGFDAYGCDFSQAAIDYALSIGLGDRCRVEDITDLSYLSKSFDTVMAFDILEHVPVEYLGTAIKECERVTKSKFIARIPYNTEGTMEALSIGVGIREHFINQPLEYWKELLLSVFVPDHWNLWLGPDDRFGLKDCFFVAAERRKE